MSLKEELSKAFGSIANAVGDAAKTTADILRQAQTTERGKQYLTVETRRSLNHDFAPIRLDVADCWPREEAKA